MAAWRATLTDQTVRRLDLLAGKPSVLAAWNLPGRVAFFDLFNGTPLGERILDSAPADNRTGDSWKQFLDNATAPNGARLPVVRLDRSSIHTSADGKNYLYQVHGGDLFLGTGGQEVRLRRDDVLVAVAFDRSLGLIAALDASANLHLYQQSGRVGVIDLGLRATEDWVPSVAIAYGGAPVFCSDGRTLVTADSMGRAQKRLPLSYTAGAMVCSPDGQHLAVADVETGVIRVYSGASLQPTHQRFAADLLGEAKPVQLMAGSVGASTALSALAINNRGALAFAMAGTICVTNVARMVVLPSV